LYIVGAVTTAGVRPELEDDVISQMGVDSMDEVKFFNRLQVKGRIVHSKAYKRVSVRNSYTISYKDGDDTKYGQVEVFVLASSPLEGSVKYAAVVLPFVEQTGFVCPMHEVLNVFPVMHIVGWNQPTTDQCVVVPVDHIKEICVCMEFKDTGIVYIANFPNHIEKD